MIEGRKKRLSDLQARVESLRDVRPTVQRRTRRLERWIDLLKQQKDQVETAKMSKELGERQQRAEAGKSGLAAKFGGGE